MRMRRRKRRTDWLFADSLAFELTFPPGATFHEYDFILLPTEYIDQNAEGSCTLLRIVGDFQIWNSASTTTSAVGPGNPFAVSLAIYKTQLDDSGGIPQLVLNPYGAPSLGASADVGGAREFLWTRNLATPFTLTATASSFSNVGNGVTLAAGPGGSTFDLHVKRRLRTGEGLALHLTQAISTAESSATIATGGVFAYRILVAR